MIGSLVKVGVTALVVCGNVFAAGEVMPFPQNKNYAGCIKPGAGDAAMNNSIKSIYLANYKPNLVVSGNECYVDAQGAGPGGASAITISEAHGYGMLLMVLLAGTNGEPNAKSYFDGMVNFYLNHPSKINSKLMSWQISNPFVADDAATDGDMDAAYALVLANAQWGGNPAGQSRSYISIAQDIITNGIKSSEMGSSNYLSLLGDWEKDGGVEVNTRSSDWMPDHMRAFKDATSDDFWTSAASRCYTNISEITAGYSSGTGLMPDFATISSGSTKPDPTAGGTTGEANPDKYSWNACRYPWRITTDYAHYGTAEAKTAMGKLADWLTTKFANPSNIKCGPYNLNGTTSINYTSSAFTGPFIAACITDSKYQSYLNSGWNTLAATMGDESDVYVTAIRLLSMLVISGNWWKPSDSPSGVVTGPDTTVGVAFDSYSNPYVTGANGQSDIGENASLSGTDSAGLWSAYCDNLAAASGKEASYVKNAAGTLLDSTNVGAAVASSEMHILMRQNNGAAKNKYPFAGFNCTVLKKKQNVDLSKLTAVVLRVKGSGNVRFSILTNDIASLGGDSAWGAYGYDIALTSSYVNLVIPVDLLAPQQYSPASDMGWSWAHGKTAAKEIAFEVLDSAGAVDITIDNIKFCGMAYSDFGGSAVTTYTLTTSGTNGAVSPAGTTTHNDGDVVSVTATPAAGYQFSGWSGSLTGTTNPASVTMNANKTITANFTLIGTTTYTLTVNATNGSVAKSPDAASYTAGAVVSLTATPAAGYQFDGWSGGATGTANPVSVTMNANTTVTASFSLIPVQSDNDLVLMTNADWYVSGYDGGVVSDTSANGVRDNNLVHFGYSVPKQPDANTWPGVDVGVTMPGNLVGYTGMSITYTSAVDIQIALPTQTGKDPFVVTLPASASGYTTKLILPSDFADADWGAPGTLDLSTVTDIAISPVCAVETAATSGTLDISHLIVSGVSWSTGVVLPGAANAPRALSITVSAGRMNLAVPLAGEYHVSLFGLDGRLIDRIALGTLAAGFHSVSLADVATGAYLVRIDGAACATMKLLLTDR